MKIVYSLKYHTCNCNLLVAVGLNFLMLNFSAGNVWFKLFPGSHNIWDDCNNKIPHKRKSISCMFDDLCIPRLFLFKPKHSENNSLGLHVSLCLL